MLVICGGARAVWRLYRHRDGGGQAGEEGWLVVGRRHDGSDGIPRELDTGCRRYLDCSEKAKNDCRTRPRINLRGRRTGEHAHRYGRQAPYVQRTDVQDPLVQVSLRPRHAGKRKGGRGEATAADQDLGDERSGGGVRPQDAPGRGAVRCRRLLRMRRL